jgi:transcriptional/translational regulatory protein YebC/TACO1
MTIVTDNRNRTAAEIRKIFDKHAGQLGAGGSAAWAFEEKGVVTLAAEAATEEQLFETAVGAGAEDLQRAGSQWIVTTPREELDAVRRALEEGGIAVESASLAQVPKTVKEVDGRDAEVLMGLVEALEDHDDVQSVFSDFELTEAALSALESQA